MLASWAKTTGDPTNSGMRESYVAVLELLVMISNLTYYAAKNEKLSLAFSLAALVLGQGLFVIKRFGLRQG